MLFCMFYFQLNNWFLFAALFHILGLWRLEAQITLTSHSHTPNNLLQRASQMNFQATSTCRERSFSVPFIWASLCYVQPNIFQVGNWYWACDPILLHTSTLQATLSLVAATIGPTRNSLIASSEVSISFNLQPTISITRGPHWIFIFQPASVHHQKCFPLHT